MKSRKVEARYARALLAALPDAKLAQSVESFLLGLGEAFERSADLRVRLLNPGVPRSARKAALRALVREAGLPTPIGRFLDLIVENRRVGDLPGIARTFREEREWSLGMVAARVASAAPLLPGHEERMRQTVERMTGRRVTLTCEVDASILGGVVTRAGSNV